MLFFQVALPDFITPFFWRELSGKPARGGDKLVLLVVFNINSGIITFRLNILVLFL
jgi:hypothetical protein